MIYIQIYKFGGMFISKRIEDSPILVSRMWLVICLLTGRKKSVSIAAKINSGDLLQIKYLKIQRAEPPVKPSNQALKKSGQQWGIARYNYR
jgi:hypothetical protein